MIARGSLASKSLAVALVVVALAVAGLTIVVPVQEAHDDYDDAISRANAMLARGPEIDRRINLLTSLARKSIAARESLVGLLNVRNASAGAGALQQRIQGLVRRHGGALESIRISNARFQATTVRVTARVRLRMDYVGFLRLARALAQSVPFILIDAVDLQGERGTAAKKGGRDRSVQIVLTVSSFVREREK